MEGNHASAHRKIIFLSLAGLIFIYLLLRAWYVPVSHDEAVTFFLYVQSGAFLPHNMVWDANNHILNSALMYPLYRLFGADMFWLRLPNVLSFLIYAWFAFKLLDGIQKQFVWFFSALALLSPLMLLEFFAQARGYGISMGLFMGALWALLHFARQPSTRAQLSVWIWFILTLSANMSMLNSYLIALALVSFLVFIRRESSPWRAQLPTYLLCGILPFGFLAFYAMQMRSKGLLYYGEKHGFVEVTVATINKYLLNTDSLAIAWIVTATGAVAGLWLILLWLRSLKAVPYAGTIAATFLTANALGAISLCILLDVNYPEDRTGIYFIPLLVLTLAYAFHHLSLTIEGSFNFGKYAAMGLAVFPITTIASANLGYTGIWRSIHLHSVFYDYIVSDPATNADNTLVESYFLTATSWGMHAVNHAKKLSPIVPARFAMGLADYAICYRENCDRYIASHDTVYRDPRNETYLMKRNEAVSWQSLKKVDELPTYSGNAEYVNFLVTDEAELVQHVKAVDLKLVLAAAAKPLHADVVISARDADDDVIYYDFMSLNWMRHRWNGDTLAVRRFVHLPEGCSKLVCYLWNAKQNDIELTFKHIELLQIGEGVAVPTE